MHQLAFIRTCRRKISLGFYKKLQKKNQLTLSLAAQLLREWFIPR